MSKYLKPMLLGLIPSLILGFGGYFLIGLLSGMEKIKDSSSIWIIINFVIFMLIFILKNNGQNILRRFLKYAAYECWLSPLCIIIYTIISMSQANDSVGTAGAVGVGFAGFLLIFVFGIGGGLLGVVFYLIGNSLDNKYKPEIANNLQSRNDSKNSNTIIKYFSVALIIVVSLALLINIKNKPVLLAPSGFSIKGYTLTDKENTILDAILLGYANFFAHGDPKFLDRSLTSVTASQVAESYNQNQVAADQKYNNKLVYLVGQIQSINSGLDNEPYISLYGIEPFLSPQAHFNDGNTQKIASLKKDQELYLVCTGNGVVIGTPMFNKCEFADDYATKKIAEIKVEVQDFLHGQKAKSKDIAILTLLAINRARTLSNNSACFVNQNLEKCLSEIVEFNEASIQEKKFALIDELKALGIQISRAPISKKITENTPTTQECSHKHKQEEMLLTTVFANGVYTEIPRGTVCKEVCDDPQNMNYQPCN